MRNKWNKSGTIAERKKTPKQNKTQEHIEKKKQVHLVFRRDVSYLFIVYVQENKKLIFDLGKSTNVCIICTKLISKQQLASANLFPFKPD